VRNINPLCLFSYPLFDQGILTIWTPNTLHKYTSVASHSDPFCQQISVLEVSIKNLGNTLPRDKTKANDKAALAANVLLGRLPNLVSLRIDFEELSITNTRRMFHGLLLPNLTGFFTNTLPHSALTNFIIHHPQLTALTLGPSPKCLRSSQGCPLKKCSPIQTLIEIEGPSKCAARLIGPQTSRIAALWSGSADDHQDLFARAATVQPPIQSVLRFIDIVFTGFCESLLNNIAQAAPSVTTLRLRELGAGAVTVCRYHTFRIRVMLTLS